MPFPNAPTCVERTQKNQRFTETPQRGFWKVLRSLLDALRSRKIAQTCSFDRAFFPVALSGELNRLAHLNEAISGSLVYSFGQTLEIEIARHDDVGVVPVGPVNK